MAGTIRKRTWTTRQGEIKTAWTANYPDRSGKWRLKTFATKKAASAYLLQAQGEMRDGIHVYYKDSVTVAEAGEMWLRAGAANGLEHSTLLKNGYFVRTINQTLGKYRLAELTPPAIEAWRDELLQTVSWVRASMTLASLEALLSNAQRQGLIVHNPASATHIRAEQRREERLETGIGIPTPAEVNTILESEGQPHCPHATGTMASVPGDRCSYRHARLRAARADVECGRSRAPQSNDPCPPARRFFWCDRPSKK